MEKSSVVIEATSSSVVSISSSSESSLIVESVSAALWGVETIVTSIGILVAWDIQRVDSTR